VDSKTSEEGGSRSPAAIRIMRLLLFLLGFLVAASLADEKYQAEDGGGLSLSAEPGPGKEILLRAKRDPKNAGTRRDSQKFKKIKNQKKTDAWKRKQRNKKENGQPSAESQTKSKIQLKLLKKKKLKEKKNEVAQTERKKSASRQCTSATVSEECLTTALGVMVWERSKVKNFLKKYSRFSKFTEQTGNKNTKRSKFQDVAAYLSEGVGGNLNNITCSNDTSRNNRRVSEYQERYNELDNCSASVEAACSNFTIPEDWDELVDCHKNLTNSPHLANSTSKIKALVQECVTLESEDADAHCSCWENINNREDVKAFQANKCIQKMDRTMKAMKVFKLGQDGVGGCLNAFKACKAAQKEAPGLVQDCMNFDESHDTAVQVDNSTARLFF